MLWDEEFQEPIGTRVGELSRFVHGLIDDMAYDPATGLASVIPVRALPQERIDESSAREGAWIYRIVDYRVELSRVSLRLESDRTGYPQLAHTWYPSQQVRHNGRVVQPIRGTMNLLVLPVRAGVNEYEILPVRTTLRRALGTFSALVLVALLGLRIRGARRRA